MPETDTFAPGTVVRLKSGGVLMTIVMTNEADDGMDTVEVIYCGADGVIRTEDFVPVHSIEVSPI